MKFCDVCQQLIEDCSCTEVQKQGREKLTAKRPFCGGPRRLDMLCPCAVKIGVGIMRDLNNQIKQA